MSLLEQILRLVHDWIDRKPVDNLTAGEIEALATLIVSTQDRHEAIENAIADAHAREHARAAETDPGLSVAGIIDPDGNQP